MTSPDKKFSLYLDACDGLKVGLLNEELEWIEFLDFPIKKASNTLFVETEKLLSNNKINLEDIASLFLCLGPGSYTGIRLLQGMKDLYTEHGIKVRSFYNFEIPLFCGIDSGCYITSAYKQEIYEYKWENEQHTQQLIEAERFVTENTGQLYGMQDRFNEIALCNVYTMLRNNPKKVLEKVLEKELSREAFYFRPLDKEFKMNFPEFS
jgi:tRNA threonylcarbamoyladenosine biosynthesis protein TsaB